MLRAVALSVGVVLVADALGQPPARRAAPLPLEAAPLRLTGCGWAPRRPARARLVVDLQLDDEASGDAGPSVSAVAAVERAGGRVLRRFHVAVVRAVFDTAALARLVGGAGPVRSELATAVVAPADERVAVQILYTAPATAADVAALRRAGADSIVALPVYPAVYATLPDSAVPTVRQLPGVQRVRARPEACRLRR